MKTIIIEDEIVAAQALENLIMEVDPSVSILTVLQSIDDSVEWFKTHPMPDLLFMDIHLADGSAFSIFEEINISCPIIFTTAYDKYALKAFEVNSIDYLLKPIHKEALSRAINKYKRVTKEISFDQESLLQIMNGIKQFYQLYKTYFLVPERDKLIPLAVKEIAFIYIDTKLVKAMHFSGKTYYLDQTLDDIMDELNPLDFFRANRQYIVARSAIKDMTIWFGNKLSLNLKVETPEKILVSKNRVKEFKSWFLRE